MDEQAFLSKLKNDVIDTETEITMDTKLADIEEWDSLAFVGFIAIAKVSGKKVDRKAVQAAQTVKELYALLA